MSASAPFQQLISLTLSGDLGTKAPPVRKLFRRRLGRNIRDLLARVQAQARVRDRRDRIDIETADPDLAPRLARVFGVQAVRVARSVPWQTAEDLVAAGVALYGSAVAGRRFAVKVRRVGKRQQIPVRSEPLARALGAALVARGGHVDLSDPEYPVHVEVRPRDALFYQEPLPGPGGLPLGVQGRALALVSGGFDSMVAAWQLLSRGVALDFVLFDLAGGEQEAAVRRALAILDQRWMAGADARLHVVDFRPVVAELRARVPGAWWQVLLKRMMLRSADQLALELGHDALVTGEVVGQVSSQTLANLRAIEAATSLPLLRPLVGLGKDAIIRQAEIIGTASVSAGVAEFCALDGGSPVTRAHPERLGQLEAQLDSQQLLPRLLEYRREVTAGQFGQPVVAPTAISELPPDAVVVDLREPAARDRWRWPDAIELPFGKAVQLVHQLPRDRRYVLVCEVGMKSAFLADLMQRSGFQAFSLAGGEPTLRALSSAGAG